jgi:hypothetical protein
MSKTEAYLEWLREVEPTMDDFHEEETLLSLFEAITNRSGYEARGTDLLWDIVSVLVESDFVERYEESFLSDWIEQHGKSYIPHDTEVEPA